MHIPLPNGLPRLEFDDDFKSNPVPLPLFGNKKCSIILDDYDEEEAKDFASTVKHLFKAEPSVLKAVEKYLWRYYKDCEEFWLQFDKSKKPLKKPADVWKNVYFGRDAYIQRRHYGDGGMYVSIECNCAWEFEHGLQIVLKDGKKVVKLGPFDGHLTNSDAYARREFENVVYVSREDLASKR